MSAFILHDRFSDPEAGRISSYFCQLFVLIGQDTFQYGIFDTDKNSFIALSDFRTPDLPVSEDDFFGQIDLLFSSEGPLHKKYPSVIIGIDSPFHTLVPATLFVKEKVEEYLDFTFRMPAGSIKGYDRIPELDAENLFGYNKAFGDITAKHFPGAVIVHRSSAFIKAVFQQHLQSGSDPGIYLNIRNPFIDIAAFEKNRAVFFNSFSCKSKEDVLYFTLYTLEQLKIRPESANLSLCGIIDAGSEIFLALGEYIRQVSFTGLPGSFKYSPLIKQVPSHHYTELFGLALCGS
jgi:hypothetical protein